MILLASYSKRYKKDPETGEILKDPKTGKDIVLFWRVQEVINGERKEFTGKTKKQAEEKLHRYKTEIETYGNTLKTEDCTLAEWMNKYLYVKSYGEISPSSFARNQSIYNHIKISNIGNMKLNQVTHLQIQEYINSLNTSDSSLRKFRSLLNQTFEYAIKNNLIRTNPAKGIIIPIQDKSERIRVLTKDQQKDYIKALEPEPTKLLYLTALFTGLRCGELLALKWKNVDLINKEIFVNENIVRTKVFDMNGNSTFESVIRVPKTKHSIRTVPIPSFLNELLIEKKNELTGDLSERFVFETVNQTPQWDCNVRKVHQRICERAKINPVTKVKNGLPFVVHEGVPFHALRHTFATRLIEAGDNVKVIQEILGHSDVQITLNIYTHALEETKKLSADKQDQLFNDLMN